MDDLQIQDIITNAERYSELLRDIGNELKGGVGIVTTNDCDLILNSSATLQECINIIKRLTESRKSRAEGWVCDWTFKSTECGCVGCATGCDKTYKRCEELGNTARFAGFLIS